MDKCKWTSSVKIFTTDINARQRVLTMEEALKNQVDKITRAVH